MKQAVLLHEKQLRHTLKSKLGINPKWVDQQPGKDAQKIFENPQVLVYHLAEPEKSQVLQLLDKFTDLHTDFRYQRKWDKNDPSVEENHPPPNPQEKALEFHYFFTTTFPFAIVKPAMHSIVDHFPEYIGDLGAMASEALESQHKDFRFALSNLAHKGDIQQALDDATKSMYFSTSEIINTAMETLPVQAQHCSNYGSSLHKAPKCSANCSNCDSVDHKTHECDKPYSRCQSLTHKLVYHKKETDF